MKGQTCVDGWTQHKKLVPRDENTPTVSTESILITATINAHEGCGVGICDRLGDFLSAEMEEDVNMELHRRLEKRMVNTSPQIYRHHVIYEKGSPFLYIILKKALHV